MKKHSKTTEYPLTELNENWFQEFWHYQRINDEKLRTEDGKFLQVVYPGRPNDIQGADFRDAVVKSGKTLLKGNVELHLKSGDWRNHHHHLDSRYNSVVLHVVLQHNTKKVTLLQNGENIPVLKLKNHLSLPVDPKYPHINGIPCSGIATGNHHDEVLEIIEKAGEARFLEKATAFSRDIRKYGKEQTLYRSMMKALGYSGNKESFEKLAAGVPLKELEGNRNEPLSDVEYLATLQLKLLGAAGFLEEKYTGQLVASSIGSDRIKDLQNRWHLSNGTVLISPQEWQFFRIRPSNSPVRRLNGMCLLLHSYRERGLLNGILDAAGTIEFLKDYRTLETELIKTSVPGSSSNRASLIGKSRASVMVINILLPFLYSEINKEAEGYRKSLFTLYRNYPKLSENSLERHMREQLGLEKPAIKTAVLQQGIFFIYQQYCTQGRCTRCGLSQLEAGDNIQ